MPVLPGPPGAGPSRLARRLTTLPAMPPADVLDTTRIHRVAGLTGGPAALVTAQTCHTPHQVSLSGVAHHLRPCGVCRCAHHRSGLRRHFSSSSGTP
jgi:predicted ATPase with chaperone activity